MFSKTLQKCRDIFETRLKSGTRYLVLPKFADYTSKLKDYCERVLSSPFDFRSMITLLLYYHWHACAFFTILLIKYRRASRAFYVSFLDMPSNTQERHTLKENMSTAGVAMRFSEASF